TCTCVLVFESTTKKSIIYLGGNSIMSQSNLVAVIGAGPAGLYASKQLASNGAKVVLFNRDVKPGGLAEYGIFHNKYRMKT
ncbi:MAG: NAD(P)-binding protein, partial [candidate division Zixibacteria bacterium]|nr:NAD(P)-binding protein [candidate division Zixibacteria bacterium]NIS45446.1 NAD(P)-binding protein [candidate division Zixibacteria bacterium]NIU13586.1 NAD(P)-binding protein [candidate division Zixibacteria bacterium]NIV05607.1 NAD(P)-binding protein [candidate division Zixibacteria bacterium]NIW44433.1 NAD(P)-binding protein [Gammaproteobacteria bacterium]